MIAVGDLNQLSPVMASPVYSSSSELVYRELFGIPLWHMFSVHKLRTIMRQRNDIAFALALNNMADGSMTADDVALMRTRVTPVVSENVKALHPLYLFHYNADLNQCNEQQQVDEIVLALEYIMKNKRPSTALAYRMPLAVWKVCK